MSVITLAKLSEEIAGHLTRELDEPFKRMLEEKIDHWRSRLLRNSLQEKPAEAHFFRQTVFIAMETASVLDDCSGVTAPICPVLRTTVPVPQPLRYNIALFDFIGDVSGNGGAFLEASAGTGEYLMAGRFAKQQVFFRYVNNYVEVLNRKMLPMLRIDHVFDRPSEALKLKCQVTGCDYWNEPYPVSGDVAQMIVQSILQVDFNRAVLPKEQEITLTPDPPTRGT